MSMALGMAMFISVMPMSLSTVQANDELNTIEKDSAVKETNETRADVIVKYFRWHGNQLQYRRYNETRGYWVDPHWINY